MATLNIKNLSDALYRKLQKRARGQHRSVAQEVTRILEAAVESSKPLSNPRAARTRQGGLAGGRRRSPRRGGAQRVGLTEDLPAVPGLNVVQLRSYLPA